MNEKAQAIEALTRNGYTKTKRDGGNHDLYINKELKSLIPVSRGTKFDKTDRDRILQEIRQARRRRGLE